MAYGKGISAKYSANVVQRLYLLGERHFAQGQYDAAITAFNSVLNSESTHINALRYKGLAHLKLAQFSQGLASFKEILKQTPEDVSAKQHVADIWSNIIAKGQEYFEKGDYQKALDIFESGLKIDDSNLNAHIQKGLAHWKLFDADSAVMSFQRVLKDEPNNQVVKNYLAALFVELGLQSAFEFNKYQANIYFETALKYSPENLKAKELLTFVSTENENLTRSYALTETYQFRLKEIQDRHKTMPNQMTNIQRAEWIVELISFINHFYKKRNTPYSFVNPGLFELSERGTHLRLRGLGAYFLQTYPTVISDHVTAHSTESSNKLDEYCLSQLQNGSDDIYFSDLFLVLRMVFETIHQLPRQDKDKANQKLPWGDSSWYYLEFLGSLFSTSFDRQKNFKVEILVDFEAIQNKENRESIEQFRLSVANYLCLVKVVSLAIIAEDLLCIDEFFRSFAEHLRNPQVDLIKMRDLPNLPILINHFKELFSLYRICAFMPHTQSPATLIELNNYNKAGDYKSTPYQQFQKTNWAPAKGLKGKFALLRQLTCLGELFTHRCFGSSVDSLLFISPLVLQSIRNGLAHIEELHSAKTVINLERNDARIDKLLFELVQLRAKVINFIITRQKQYPLWPQTNQEFQRWQPDVTSYWQQVSKRYHEEHDLFNEQTYAPGQPLLAEKDILWVLSLFKDTTADEIAFKRNFEKELRGELRPSYKELNNNVYLRYVKDEEKNKSNRKYLGDYITAAYKKYDVLRRERKEEVVKESREREQSIRKCQQMAVLQYPTLHELSEEFTAQLNDHLHKMSPNHLLINLNLRFKNLMDLLAESHIVFNLEQTVTSQFDRYTQFNKLLNEDIQFFLACGYLLTQIISILNHFSTARIIPALIPEANLELNDWLALMGYLKLRLMDWVSLRNLMMHSDSIVESEELFAFQIHFHKLPTALSQVIVDLLFNVLPKIKSFSPQLLEKIVLSKDHHIRQHEPFNYKRIEHIFELMLLKEQGCHRLRFYKPEGKSEATGEGVSNCIKF